MRSLPFLSYGAFSLLSIRVESVDWRGLHCERAGEDLRRGNGGAVASVEDVEESERGDGEIAEGVDPENGPARGVGGAVARLQETAEKALEANLMEIVTCLVDNVKIKHLPSVKLLFELAARVKVGGDVPVEEMVSISDFLRTQLVAMGGDPNGLLGPGEQIQDAGLKSI